MKKLFTNFLGLALSVMVLASCSQMATYEQADLTPEEVAAAAKDGFNLTPYGTGGNENAAILAGGGDCTTDCIDETSGNLFAATGTSPTVNFGGGPAASSKTLSVSVWNTLTTIEYRITITGTGSTFQAGNLQYYDETINPVTQLPIGWVNADGGGSLVATVAYVVSRPLAEGWEACDVVTEQWRQVGGGSPVSLGDVSYNLIGECSDCDEASFTYETADNQNIIFTYNHGEEVESLTLAFTFPQILDLPLNGEGKYVGSDGKVYTVNNPTNQTVFTWTGEVSCKASEAETFDFSVVADCSARPANDGQALIWTDAKIIAIDGEALVDNLLTTEVNEGPYSLKGDLENIVFEGCPINP